MLTYTVDQKNGFHGGTCESFQRIERDGQAEINGSMLKLGRPEPLSTRTGNWRFFDSGVLIYQVDLDALNGTTR